jgi:hypothetical protein
VKFTCFNLRSALRERRIPHTGTKLEMVRRLAFFIDKIQMLLYSTLTRSDQDLSESEGEEGNDVDPKDAEGAGDTGSLSRTL